MVTKFRGTGRFYRESPKEWQYFGELEGQGRLQGIQRTKGFLGGLDSQTQWFGKEEIGQVLPRGCEGLTPTSWLTIQRLLVTLAGVATMGQWGRCRHGPEEEMGHEDV